MDGTLTESSTCKCLISGKKSKFAAEFEIFNLKKGALQNPLNLIIDYVRTCTKAPVIFPHNI